MPSRSKITVAAVLLGLFIYRSGDLVKNVILNKTPLPVGYVAEGDYEGGSCEALGPQNEANPLDSLAYCEDTAFWELHKHAGDETPSSRLVLATCDANRKSWNTVMGPLRDPNPRGTLWVYTPSANSPPKPSKVTFEDYPEGHDFHPLGFEIWPSYGGSTSNLYVVNHARERTVIEQFLMDPSKPTVAKHIRTISSPYFVSPNSVALTSPDSFYVTNDHLITRRWPIVGHVLPLLESILGLPLSFVSHITLKPPSSVRSLEEDQPPTNEIASHTFAAKFIPFPNGIALSSSGRQVAVASSSLAKVFFYDRDPLTNALTPIRERTATVPFCPDNVRYVHNGVTTAGGDEELIVAGHPHFPSLINLAKNATGATAGSWVVSIIPKTPIAHSDKKNPHEELEEVGVFDIEAPISTSHYVSAGPTWTLKTLFQSNGDSERGFTSSSTAIRDPSDGTLYVSGLYDAKGVIACRPTKGGK
ncbi:arylesterase [Ephemerocybe angulata]|uniref:Arylesterase n=1 Tax=Ephemerocybe angulata TaxID=980116 RepID=A0A8H6HY72_9AGAR|nr:arylesterase [Tulosesus angulatus]